ncbi:MAG: hypothetical protein EPO08_08045 [Rhodospirillaceae bacterium]|nr:MAG: hypothetical protein EPO08_08045 [Rhodospirillaceae bacterium]
MKMNASRGAQIGMLVGLYFIARDYSDGKFLPWVGSGAISQNLGLLMGKMMFMVALCSILGAAMGWGMRLYQRKTGRAETAVSPEPKP